MVSDATASSRNGLIVLDHWSARKVRPVVVFYVVVVFVAFMAMAHFIFHSPKAVKALLIAAVGGVAATIPGVIEKVEYRLTESGIEKSVTKKKGSGGFADVFRWDELNHILPMKHGFKYYKIVNETSLLRRFWQTHISDEFSGEVRVEKKDLGRILGMVERRGITIS
jgi:hypothetical protein